MAQAGSPVTASPLTTLIAAELDASGTEYSDSTAEEVLKSLGFTDLLNNGVDVANLLSNTEAVLKELATTNPADAATLAATTAVLSDVLKSDPTASVAAISTATATLSNDILDSNPHYPASGADGTGDDIFVEFNETTLKTYVAEVEDKIADPSLPEPTPPTPDLPKAEPVDPPKPTPPPTGGTGGTGGGGGAGA